MARRRLSLETRLAMVLVLGLIALSSTLFVWLTSRERSRLVGSKGAAASMVAQLLASELAPAIEFGDTDGLTASLDHLRANSDIVAAGVWANGASADPLAEWAAIGTQLPAAPKSDEADGVTTMPDWLLVTRSIDGHEDKPLGRLRIVFTLRPENESFRSTRANLFTTTVGLSALMALVLGLLARRYVVGPIKTLSVAATALADGNLSARVAVRGDDEIGDLARAFNVMSDAVAFRHERLQKEVELAQRIQTSLLPRALKVPGLEMAAAMVPTTQVGGDYYDVLPTENGSWMAIGDVSGHGLDAGLIMLMMQAVVAAHVERDRHADPKDVVCTLNRVLYENIHGRLRRDHHATLTILHYDQAGSVRFAGAHEPILVWREADRRVEVIDTPGTWVGGRRDIESVTVDSSIRLHPGDVLLLHTDGVTETHSAKGAYFGIQRLCHELERVHDRPATAIKEHILSAARQWGVADDDITLVVARYLGTEGRERDAGVSAA